jgi:TonB family protein
MIESAALAVEPAGGTPTVEQPAPSAEGTGPFGAPDAAERIRDTTDRNERALWASALGITLLYAGIIAAQVMGLGGLSALEHELEQQRQERRGQDATSISVELVPDPDKTSKTEKWRDGAQQSPNPSPAPPQPQQQASLPQPEVAPQPPTEEPAKEEPKQAEKAEKEKPVDKDDKKTEHGKPTIPDLEALVDAAADDLNEKIKEHYDRRQQRPQRAQPEQQAMYSGGGMQVRGTGASGKSDEFSKSVIDALMKTRPGPFALWGRVLVSFQITQQGDLLYVHLVHSSGNKALDDAAIEAIHKAQFVKPPPGLSPEARTYIIDYVFG